MQIVSTESSVDNLPRYYGKYPGVVVDNAAPSDGAAHQGVVAVEVSILMEEAAGGTANRRLRCNALPCLPPGFFFIPDIGDHVWVEFVAGNIDFPIWTGVWYPRDGTPQTQDGSSPTEFEHLIRTGAHVIQLDDSQDNQTITIAHKSGSSIEIDPSGRVTIKDAGNNTSIVSTRINLGTQGGAAYHLVLSEKLEQQLDQLLNYLRQFLNHTHATGVGPSGPSLTQQVDEPILQMYRKQLAQIRSRRNTTD